MITIYLKTFTAELFGEGMADAARAELEALRCMNTLHWAGFSVEVDYANQADNGRAWNCSTTFECDAMDNYFAADIALAIAVNG